MPLSTDGGDDRIGRSGPEPETEYVVEPPAGQVGSALTWSAVQLGAERGLSVVRFLILARLLSPGDFGLLAIATVAVELLLAVTNFGLQPALVQLQERERRHYDAAWTVGLLRGMILSSVLFLGAGFFAQLYGEPDATPLLQLVALRPLLGGLSNPRLADLERELNFRALALITTGSTIVHTALAIALAPLVGVSAVVIGMLAGTVVSAALGYWAAPFRPRLRFDRTSAGPLLRFGRWVLATSIIGIVGEAVLRGVISRELGSADLGMYYLAARLAYLPNGVVSNVVGSVAFPVHARLRHAPAKAAEALATSLRSLVALLVPTYVVLVVLAPALTRDVLGPQWEGTSALITVLACAALLGLIADAVFPMLEGRGEPHRITMLIAMRAVILVAVVWPLASGYGVVGAAAATIAAELPIQIIAVGLARSRLPRPFRGVGSVVAAAAVAGALGAAVGLAVDRAVGPPIGVVPAALCAGIGSMIALWALDRTVGLRLAEQLVRVFPALRRLN
jgi:O-antigen/teichoic acid export membrane protein